MKRRRLRDFSGFADAKTRTTRLFKQVVGGFERLGVCWKPTEKYDEDSSLLELASWLPLAPADPECARVTLKAPGGLRGFLLVHRTVLNS